MHKQFRSPARASGGYTVNTNHRSHFMHIKKRGNTLSLYRSVWVPKGTRGNTHGFSQQKFVTSVPEGSTDIPAHVRDLLTEQETHFVEQSICAPARAAQAQARAAAARLEADPVWRIEEAVRLLEEAATRSADALVPEVRVSRITAAAGKIRTIGQQGTRPPIATVQTDPMRDALISLQAAARAVKTGRYGNGPAEGMKSTPIYARWLELQDALEGPKEESLMRCLQARGFVKTRQR